MFERDPQESLEKRIRIKPSVSELLEINRITTFTETLGISERCFELPTFIDQSLPSDSLENAFMNRSKWSRRIRLIFLLDWIKRNEDYIRFKLL
jgi:hypothetical protein